MTLAAASFESPTPGPMPASLLPEVGVCVSGELSHLLTHLLQDHTIFFSVMLGLMASAPLQELVFSSCNITTDQVCAYMCMHVGCAHA